jgi:hypothetical protein
MVHCSAVRAPGPRGGARFERRRERPFIMREKCLAVALSALAAMVTSVTPVAAQTTASSTSQWFIGATGGAAAVQNVGAAYGAEVGTAVTPKVDVFAELLGMADVATRRRIGTAMDVASVLQLSQGVTASATLKAPATLFLGGLRFVIHQSGGLRIFVQGGAGVARVTFQPTFTLAGADITNQLAQFGVTLGADLAGTTTKPAFGGGLGLEMRHGVWYIGAQAGLVSIKTPSQPSNVVQATVSFGRWF